MESNKSKKIFGLSVVTIVYAITIILGIILYKYLPIEEDKGDLIILKFFIVDIFCTIFIFLVGLIFKNASFYDPYWSVAPMVMSIFMYLNYGHQDIFGLILVVLILIWGARLTINWAIKFNDIHWIDWRYKDLHDKKPKLYFFVNLFGIHLVPTLVVFVAMLPVFSFIYAVDSTGSFENAINPTVMTIVGLVFVLFAIIIETIADLQMLIFKKNPVNQGRIMDVGLWKNCRHPNYFGEIFFWFSLFLVYFSYQGANLLMIFSPLVIFLLFEFISIPMMDKRQMNNKPGFKEYKDSTNALLPIFPPKK